jgi:hypothetical protein
LVNGQTVEQDIKLTKPQIKGYVMKPGGKDVFLPRDEKWVDISLERVSDGAFVTGCRINDDGSYRLGENTPEGDYILRAHAEGKNNLFKDSAPVFVHISTDQIIIQNLILENDITIADLVVLSHLYGFRTGDPKWDSKYDLEPDGIIDLYDLIRLARLLH